MMDHRPLPVESFIRVVEAWVPDAEGALLVLGGAWYGAARRFGMSSREMCFGRGEGLPGQAWETGRPIVLKQFEGSAFRRTAAAHADGLNCGIALPVFQKDRLMAVLLIFCGDQPGEEQLDLPDGDGRCPLRREGFCEAEGVLDHGRLEDQVASGEGAVGLAHATAVPQVVAQAVSEPGGVGVAARTAGLQAVVALPVLAAGRVVAVVAWYF